MVIRVSHLRKHFGQRAVVDDVSFAVAPGETLVLLGPSGCGKTTLLKMLNRLIEPDGGTVEINGTDVRRQAPEALRRGLGYVIQQVGLLPHLTVAQNVGVVPGLLGWPPARTAARTTALLDRLGLPAAHYGPLLPGQLSGGQQQRVGLARALAADPPIVLLDEPFGALDPLTRAAVRRDFRELDELRCKTVVLVTHDVAEAFELADRVMLLNEGKIQQLGSPRELLLHPATDFVRRFFAAERLALLPLVLTLADLLPHLPPAAGPPPAHLLPPATRLQAALTQVAGNTSAPAETTPPNVWRGRQSSGDPRQSPDAPRQTSGDPRSTSGDPRQTSGDPRSTSLPLRQTFGDPRPTSGDPRPTSGEGRPAAHAVAGVLASGGAAPGAWAVAGPGGQLHFLTLPGLLAALGAFVVAAGAADTPAPVATHVPAA